MSVVIFDVAKFRTLYPLIKLSDVELEYCFAKAELLLNNSKRNLICDLKKREILLYILTAHFATLQDRINNGNDAVGRVSSASEGSVSVSLDYPQGNGSAFKAWLDQTQYGAEYWVMTAQYRTMRYIPSPFPRVNVNRWRRG